MSLSPICSPALSPCHRGFPIKTVNGFTRTLYTDMVANQAMDRVHVDRKRLEKKGVAGDQQQEDVTKDEDKYFKNVAIVYGTQCFCKLSFGNG